MRESSRINRLFDINPPNILQFLLPAGILSYVNPNVLSSFWLAFHSIYHIRHTSEGKRSYKWNPRHKPHASHTSFIGKVLSVYPISHHKQKRHQIALDPTFILRLPILHNWSDNKSHILAINQNVRCSA
jgi:hypothetical protein